MKTVLVGNPPHGIEDILQRRRALGQDGFDEVWEGVYHVAPMAHSRHGYIGRQLAFLLEPLARQAGLVSTDAFNLGEPEDYRVPDGGYHRSEPAALYVPTAAIVVEVVSPDDETWQKFGFFAAHGVEEICTAEPLEHRVRWWRRDGDHFVEAPGSELLGVTTAELEAEINWPR